MRSLASALLRETLGTDIDPSVEVASLSLGERQLVEIAKAIQRSSSLLILDEPTTCLSLPERQHLFDVVHRLRASGYGILYITHFLEEVYELANRILVLRDGSIAAQGAVSEIPVDQLTRAMVGREQENLQVEPAPVARDAPVVLKAERLSDPSLVRDVSFELRRGEILGVAGLMGAGRSEMAEILVGLRKGSGAIILNGQPFDQRSPRSALQRGMVLVSEDRRKDQAFLAQASKRTLQRHRCQNSRVVWSGGCNHDVNGRLAIVSFANSL
jgi:ABC-type sugar transport system ATPase subunit